MSKMLTREEAANILNVSVTTLDRWIRAGIVSAVKIGGSVRIPQSTLDKIIQTGGR